MATCSSCRGVIVRTRRTWLEWWLYRAAYECLVCGRRTFDRRSNYRAVWQFVWSTRTQCPHCGGHDVRPMRQLTQDAVSHHPLSRLLQRRGAPSLLCTSCRIRYYDDRPGAVVADDDESDGRFVYSASR